MADASDHIPYEHLLSYVLAELDPAQARAIQAHVLNCPSCAAKLRELQLISDQLRVIKGYRPSDASLTRVMRAFTRQREPARSGWASLAWAQFHLRQVLLVAVAVLSAAGVWAVINESRMALPGDRLYVVRRAAENVDLASTLSDVGRARIHVGLIRNRVNDIVALTLAGRYEDIPPAVDEFRSEIDDTAMLLRAVSGHDQRAGTLMVQQVEQSLNDGAQVLSTLSLAGPLGEQPVMRTAIEASVAGKNVLRAQLTVAARAALDTAAPQITLAPVAATALASSPWSATLATWMPPPATRTATPTASIVPSGTPASTFTASPTGTAPRPSPSASSSATHRITSTPAQSITPPSTPSPSATASPFASATTTPTTTPMPSATDTSQPTATDTQPPSATPTPLPTDTLTPEPSETPSPLPTDTAAPTLTPLPTDTNTPVISDTPLPTNTDAPLPTATLDAATPTSTEPFGPTPLDAPASSTPT